MTCTKSVPDSRASILDFLALPRELRDMVYHHALDWNDPQTIMEKCRVQIEQARRIDSSKKTIKRLKAFWRLRVESFRS